MLPLLVFRRASHLVSFCVKTRVWIICASGVGSISMLLSALLQQQRQGRTALTASHPAGRQHLTTLCRELGDTFKWLFYGDDDTMWLRPNPDLLVQAYDANIPHVLTGGSRGREHCLCRSTGPCGCLGDSHGPQHQQQQERQAASWRASSQAT
jgi:hypothetical protein